MENIPRLTAEEIRQIMEAQGKSLPEIRSGADTLRKGGAAVAKLRDGWKPVRIEKMVMDGNSFKVLFILNDLQGRRLGIRADERTQSLLTPGQYVQAIRDEADRRKEQDEQQDHRAQKTSRIWNQKLQDTEAHSPEAADAIRALLRKEQA